MKSPRGSSALYSLAWLSAIIGGCAPIKERLHDTDLSSALPATASICTVNSDIVNFREKPCINAPECKILRTLKLGDRLQMSGESATSPEGTAFAGATFEGMPGWIAQSLISCDSVPAVLPTSEPLAAWAYTPTSDDKNKIRQDLEKIKSGGANAVYISHSNPGEIDDFWPSEIGMTFAVWNALYGDPHDTGGRAEIVYSRIRSTLEIANQLNLKTILAVGYQIEMGRFWNDKNPDALRRNSDGSLMKHWQDIPTASPYNAKFQSDIQKYYTWVNNTLVKPFPNVVGLNLADEPMGSDFSAAAKARFSAQNNGKDLLGNDGDNELRGEFLSGVIADYATITASMWQQLNPNIWVTMTFHFQRDLFWFPSMEKIFAKTPANFVVSTDTHYHDAPANQPILHLGLLHNLTKNMALLSKCYNKNIMLWSSANGWGLTPNGNAGMAAENLQIVSDWQRRFGAKSKALLFWGFNIPDQGLFEHPPGNIANEQQNIWNTLSAATPGLLAGMKTIGSELPSTIYLMSRQALNRKFGSEKTWHIAYPHLFDWGQRQGELKDSSAVIMVDGNCAEKLQAPKQYIFQ